MQIYAPTSSTEKVVSDLSILLVRCMLHQFPTIFHDLLGSIAGHAADKFDYVAATFGISLVMRPTLRGAYIE